MTIEDLSTTTVGTSISTELVVIGSGPAGIVTALEAAGRGIDVVLVESGSRTFDPSVQDLSAAAAWDPTRHAPMPLAIRRQVGGTSAIWGGRCVPYDPIDFERRPFVDVSSWPVTYDEMAGYFQRSCDWLVCGRAMFDAAGLPDAPASIVPGLEDGGVTASTLERWSLPTDFGATYLRQLTTLPRLRLLTGVTATRIVVPPENGAADHVAARTTVGGEVTLHARAIVVACGGLEGTRLLLSSPGPRGGQLGAESGHLGRWYMAHAEGVIANLHFSTPAASTVFDYERDVDGVYVRRRFAFTEEFQLEHELPNIAGWIANPELPDAAHGNGQLSFVYLALHSPLGPMFAPDAQRLSLTGVDLPGTPYGGSDVSPGRSHLRNIVRQPLSTGRFMVDFGTRRLLASGRKAPGFFVRNERNIYPMQYHGEHLPNRASQVRLTRQTDRLGRPMLDIDLRFSEADVDGVIRAHRYWDEHLRSSGVGRLEYLYEDLHDAVDRRLGGGFHQVGTTRMSADPADGVVDKNLAVHGVSNVFVASSSTFVTSGQANSTFMIVAFALRLADHLEQVLHPR
ncbi:MAG: FAD-dependent oxidoreductase [Acidimicrobiales bacterium]|jgi:choline dehydrogenase-like flavoprotein